MRLPLPDLVLRTVGRQLGGPSGPLGALFARLLNSGNRGTIAGAVDALELAGNESVADIGFCGGVGLELLLVALPDGHVHGVDPSTDMVARARRRHADRSGPAGDAPAGGGAGRLAVAGPSTSPGRRPVADVI